MTLTFSRDEFQKEFGKSLGEVFDLHRIADVKQMMVEAMGHTDRKTMLMRAYYTTVFKGPAGMHVRLEVGYFIGEDTRLKASIRKVLIFDTLQELLDHKKVNFSQKAWVNPQDN